MAQSINTYTKDKDAIKDYTIDWGTEWLKEPEPDDTIATSSWAVPAGLTKQSETNSTLIATVWISGGVPGTVYVLTNHITTAGGRTDERSITIRVTD